MQITQLQDTTTALDHEHNQLQTMLATQRDQLALRETALADLGNVLNLVQAESGDHQNALKSFEQLEQVIGEASQRHERQQELERFSKMDKADQQIALLILRDRLRILNKFSTSDQWLDGQEMDYLMLEGRNVDAQIHALEARMRELQRHEEEKKSVFGLFKKRVNKAPDNVQVQLSVQEMEEASIASMMLQNDQQRVLDERLETVKNKMDGVLQMQMQTYVEIMNAEKEGYSEKEARALNECYIKEGQVERLAAQLECFPDDVQIKLEKENKHWSNTMASKKQEYEELMGALQAAWMNLDRLEAEHAGLLNQP
jgi:hypothetical protein